MTLTKELCGKILFENLNAAYVKITDQSHLHASHYETPAESLSHVQITIVSEDFRDLSLVKRHQKINALFKPYFEGTLHALQLQTFTQDELS